MVRAKKPKKHRIVEYSEDESDADEDSDWTVETDETAKMSLAAGGGENEPSGTDKERTPKTVSSNKARRQRENRRDNGEESTNRIVEYSEDESDADEDSDWSVETDETAKMSLAAGGGENEPSGTDKERTPKTVNENKARRQRENRRDNGEESTKWGE